MAKLERTITVKADKKDLNDLKKLIRKMIYGFKKVHDAINEYQKQDNKNKTK